MSEDNKNTPYLCWTPKLLKVLLKYRFIAGSNESITKDLSFLLTKILKTIKGGLIRHCSTITSCIGVNSISYVSGLLKMSQVCCHPWTDVMSIQQHQSRHTTF